MSFRYLRTVILPESQLQASHGKAWYVKRYRFQVNDAGAGVRLGSVYDSDDSEDSITILARKVACKASPSGKPLSHHVYHVPARVGRHNMYCPTNASLGPMVAVERGHLVYGLRLEADRAHIAILQHDQEQLERAILWPIFWLIFASSTGGMSCDILY